MSEVEIMAVGSLVFWIIMAVWIVILWLLVENEHGALGLVAAAGYLCILKFGFGISVELFALANFQYILLGAVGYFIIGGIWSCIRWHLYATDELEPYLKMRNDWLASKGQVTFKKVPEDLKEEWAKYLKADSDKWTNDSRTRKCKVPLYKDHVTKVMRWIGYWPISLLTWIFNDMVRTFVRMVANFLADWLQSIANRVFSVVSNDLPEGFKLD
jgi:hypothetical protein